MTGSTIPHNDNLDVLRGIAVLGVLFTTYLPIRDYRCHF